MKKIVLFALLLATVTAASAHAINEPRWGYRYTCYFDNYSGPAEDPGTTIWTVRTRTGQGPSTIVWSYETFDVSYGTGTDTYKAAWAKPADQSNGTTVWEHTLNGGAQCKRTVVYPYGNYIFFEQCTDGHTRTCLLG